MVATTQLSFLDKLFATKKPNAAETEVELCPAPKESYGLSKIEQKPDNPLFFFCCM